ncbi:hypothetical protein DC31_02340 [Microbacterium sp. CH12i]|uniref:hypothetical protein n=1 Tax=Microbacterium sp. CH12i TaxID=1479651 RepID=UPI0004611340|nr:hypothetical protein [Microbacterium sp. CH12i]KDA05231.1 hypothetical protein DC31_02340 [Microbacterium sp. CH12i]
MNRSQKITAAVSGLVVACLVAVAAPAVASVVSGVGGWALFNQSGTEQADASAPSADTVVAADSTDNPDGIPDGYVDIGNGTWVPEGGPGDCTATAWINIAGNEDGPTYATLTGAELIDMGPREFAAGAVGLDEQGQIETYTVEPGDALFAIGDRFCFGNALTLGTLNHRCCGTAIQPGDVLYLRPDPTLPLVSSFMPYAAEPGTSTIPYFHTVYEFSTAIAARDLPTAQSVWDRLSVDVSPDAASVITQALSESNWTLLRRMFP